jgi:hypothetical protein
MDLLRHLVDVSVRAAVVGLLPHEGIDLPLEDRIVDELATIPHRLDEEALAIREQGLEDGPERRRQGIVVVEEEPHAGEVELRTADGEARGDGALPRARGSGRCVL